MIASCPSGWTEAPIVSEAMTRDRRFLSTGFTALDIIVRGDEIWHAAGGTAANVAANLRFLGWEAALAGRVGDDETAVRLSNDLRSAGVDLTSLRSMQGARTAMVVHEITSTRHRFRFSCPECGRRLPRFRPIAERDAKDVLASHTRVDVFFFDRATRGAVALASAYRAMGALIFFEPSRVGYQQHFRAAVCAADIVKFSAERQSALDASLTLHRSGQLRIVTMGPLGLRLSLGTSRWTRLPAFPIEVTDSGGAGDWATAGFLSALPTVSYSELSLDDFRAAAEYGQALAALSCRYPGARGLSASVSSVSAARYARSILEGRSPRRTAPGRKSVRRVTSHCWGCFAAA
jgi:fructokinase